MALNSSSGESAVLEIEVDVSGFDALDKRAQESANKFSKSYEFMGNAAAKGFKVTAASAQKATAEEKALTDAISRGVEAYDRSAKAADRLHKKIGIAAAASIAAWGAFFDFLESGSGEAGERFRALNDQLDRTKASLAEATGASGPVSAMASLLEAITNNANSGSTSMRMLGEAAGAMIAPFTAGAVGVERMVRALQELTGLGVVPAPSTPTTNPNAGANSVANRSERARIASLGTMPTEGYASFVSLPELEIVGNPGRRGGGGGGRGQQTDPIWQRYQREQEVSAQIARLRDQEAQAAVDATQRGIEETTRQSEAWITDRHDMFEAGINAQMAFEERRAELDDAGTQAAMQRVEMLRQSWVQMGTATMQVVMTNLLATGSFDKAARAGLSALGTMAAFRALFEGAEAIAALVTPGMQGFAAGHAKAAAMFGAVAVGTAVAGKLAFGGSYGRASNGSRGGADASVGGSGGFSSPRGTPSGGGGAQKVEQTFIIKASGDILDSDRGLRRLARHIRNVGERSY